MINPDPVNIYLARLEETIHNISRDQIWSVIHLLMDTWRAGQQIFILGNGG